MRTILKSFTRRRPSRWANIRLKLFLKKPNSTIGLGFKMLSDGSLQAFSSTGNSGAMLVGAMYTIRTIPGVIRPSITSALPVLNGGVSLILDVGINADCKPDVLYQFGILGSIMAEQIYNIDNPKGWITQHWRGR